MQYILCNTALFAQDILFLNQKSTFWTKYFRKSQQILISLQNSVCWGLNFSSETKLFGVSPSHLRTAFATLH